MVGPPQEWESVEFRHLSDLNEGVLNLGLTTNICKNFIKCFLINQGKKWKTKQGNSISYELKKTKQKKKKKHKKRKKVTKGT